MHIETCVIPLWKAVLSHPRALCNWWECSDPQNEQQSDFSLVTVPFRHIDLSVIPL